MALRDLIDIFSMRDRGPERRRGESVELASKLYSMGLDDPELINQTVDNYVKTGALVLPTAKETRRELGDRSVRQEGRTTISNLGTTEVETHPVRLGAGLTVIGPDGEPTSYDGNFRNVRVLPRPAAEKVPGMTRFFAEDEAGNVRVTNAVPSKNDRWIRVGTKPGGGKKTGGSGQTAQERADLAALAAYQRALQPKYVDGVAVPPSVPAELEGPAIDAAMRLGLPVFMEVTPAVPPTSIMGFDVGGQPESRRMVIGNQPINPNAVRYQVNPGEQGQAQPGPGKAPPAPSEPQEPRYQRNKKTGKRRVSYDGGQTWQPYP